MIYVSQILFLFWVLDFFFFGLFSFGFYLCLYLKLQGQIFMYT